MMIFADIFDGIFHYFRDIFTPRRHWPRFSLRPSFQLRRFRRWFSALFSIISSLFIAADIFEFRYHSLFFFYYFYADYIATADIFRFSLLISTPII
jgi:hypothetical protein